MSANFYGAILGFSIAIVGTLAISRARGQALPQPSLAEESVCSPVQFPLLLVLLAAGIVCLCAAFNVFFW
jgi:hypothetical protein